MKVVYCEKIKEIKKSKEFERKQIIDELITAKLEWNYPKIKMYESKEALLDSQLMLIKLMSEAMKDSCPRENLIDDICELSCKTYYDYVLSVIKHGKQTTERLQE